MPAAGAAELVAVEAEQVPVPMVGRHDVAQLADVRNDLLRLAVVYDHLVGDHRRLVGSRPVPLDHEGTVAHVADGGAKS